MSNFQTFDDWRKQFNKRGLTQFFSRKNKKKQLIEYLANDYKLLTDFINSNLDKTQKLDRLECLRPHLYDFASSLDIQAGKFANSIRPNTRTLADFLGEESELFFSGLNKQAGKFFRGFDSELITLISDFGSNLEFVMRGLKENSRQLAYVLDDQTFKFAQIIAADPKPFISGSGKYLASFTRGLEHRARDFGQGLGPDTNKFTGELKTYAKALARGFAQYNFDFALGIQLEVKQLVLGLGPYLTSFSAGLGDHALLFREGLGPYLSTFMITQDNMQDYFLGTNMAEFTTDANHINFGKTHRILPRCYLCRTTINKNNSSCPTCNINYHKQCKTRLKQCKTRTCNNDLS